jgi:hypothetical protein
VDKPDARIATIDALKVQADKVLRGDRSHIEVQHLDALRIVDLVRELIDQRDALRRSEKQLWERMDVLEAHIERLGSSADAAFAAQGIEAREGEDALAASSQSDESPVSEADAP